MENKYDVSSLYENYSIEEVSMDDIISIIEGASINKLNTDGTTSLFSDELVTYLYSGFVSDEIHSNQVVISMENVRILDLTEAAYLLSDKGFKQLILEAFTNDILNGKYSLNSMLELIQKGISIDEKNELLALMSKGKDMSALEIERVAEIARGGFLYEPEKVLGL